MRAILAQKDNHSGIQLEGHDGLMGLELRGTDLDREILDAGLPEDALSLITLAISERQKGLDSRYQMVLIYRKIKSQGKFWIAFGYRTLDELLVSLDLPNGGQLARWEQLVELFSKDTFLLIGDEALSYMTSLVGQYQLKAQLRKRDYQSIFEGYCREHSSFDRASFYQHINSYVNNLYSGSKAVRTRRKPARKASNIYQPKLNRDAMRPAGCLQCEENRRLVTALSSYISTLEGVIRRELGERYVPARPPAIR